VLAYGHVKDIEGVVAAGGGNPEDLDVTKFAKSFVTVTGRKGDVEGPSEGITYASQDKTWFYSVQPATDLEYALTIDNDLVKPKEQTQVFRLSPRIVSDNGVFAPRPSSSWFRPRG